MICLGNLHVIIKQEKEMNVKKAGTKLLKKNNVGQERISNKQ